MPKMPIVVAMTSLLILAMLMFAVPAYATTPVTATFSGTATIHVVLVNGGQMRLTNVPFSVVATALGAGVGTLFLTIDLGPNPLGMPNVVTVGGFVATGTISVTSNSATGGGTIAPPEASQDGFGVTTNSGGQFQCQNVGFSALLSMGIRQMHVHGSVSAGSLVTS